MMFVAMTVVAAASLIARAADDGLKSPGADANRGAGRSTACARGPGDVFGGLRTRGSYQPGKIPVVLIHGLGLGLGSWTPTIEALETDRRLSDSYQFWTFTYNTEASILYSAARLRQDLARARQSLDPKGTDRAFDQMVVIGHSMGGLLARLMAQRSGSAVWHAFSEHPFEELAGPPAARGLLRDVAFFEPQPMVRRVILIATPHQGSHFGAGGREIAAKLLHGPEPCCKAHDALLAANAPGFFEPWFQRRCPDSIQDLSRGTPVLAVLSRLEIDPAVKVHSIIARRLLVSGMAEGDGIVSYRSAHLEGVASERIVPTGHFCQGHPQVIAEIRRILEEHLLQAGHAVRKGPPLRRASLAP